ncbi:MAG TPA: hypothetical protein VH877_25590, partial [Polyangia bacterium]|nr:hypothetical protein [Polyangia bacterium]
MRWWICSVVLTSACFKVGGINLDSGPPRPPISHVPESYLANGTCDLIISASSLLDGLFLPLDASILEGPMHTFDTGTGQLDGKSVPTGCISQLEAQQGRDGGIEDAGSGASNTVAVLAVRNLTIEAGAILQVTGPYPLVIAAGDTIRVEGTIDAS